MKKITHIFLTGLLAVLPLSITLFILIWLTKALEYIFGGLLSAILPEQWYIPSMGLVIGFASIFLLGILLQSWVVRKFQHSLDHLILTFPLIGDLYRSVKGLTNYLADLDATESDQVVMVTLNKDSTTPIRLLGLVTRDNFNDAPKGIDDGDTVAVFLPWGYQMGGFTIYVAKSSLSHVDMSKKQALRWALTAAVSASND